MLLEVTVSRVQLALNVSNIDEAVDYYSRLFATEPAKRRPGYANFAIEDPPLKLVLIENLARGAAGVDGALNHLGVEVETTDEVNLAIDRLRGAGLATDRQEATTCCYAVQDKAWSNDPDGVPWEYYTVLSDAPGEADLGCRTDAGTPPAAGVSPSACC